MLTNALSYAARQWRVLPVHGITDDGACTCGEDHIDNPGTRGKHPAIKDWVTLATTDAARIERFYRGHPNFNIGLATGEGSGFDVLDIDPKNGGTDSLATLCATYGALPLTLTAVTGSGGRHFFFKHLPGQGNRANLGKEELGQKITGMDMRGDGGQVVAAPSRHMSGKNYQWVDERTPIAAPPDWLVAMLAPVGAGTPRAAQAADEWARLFLGGAGEGARNDSISRLAGYLFSLQTKARIPLDSYIVAAIMQMWNERYVHPPLHPEEVRTILNSVARKDAKKKQKKWESRK